MKTSKSTAPLFPDLNAFAEHLGATHVIRKLLLANNGLAAVKGIRSIRSWLYDHLGDEEAIQMCVMASQEDLKANAEFVHMADQHVEVPGGANRNNYANVDLIVSTALQMNCDGVYPGWGHASENPALPRECERTRKVAFLGPMEDAMFALGDKIASTIIAQSNGVPTVPWSGDAIRLPPGTFTIDHSIYEQSYVKTVEECEDVCRRIGFPVMIKASEGGGGKGIRRVLRQEDVPEMFTAVAEEVKGCHIFVMRMLENVRHLEVQLLADGFGNCIAVRTRDCSVQRRHQKIIEEGPVVGVDPQLVEDMEQAAIRLALAVGYRGLGTVEYMYDKNTHTFSFLELNPRIQVEHPVSELISGVNLPAALLCVGMGVALHRIPEIRTYYGEEPYGTTPIDFTTRKSQPPRCHAIAVRITAEDVDEGFRPSTGTIDEISFRNSKECWGYFSVASGGAVHQFADSQFGHIFSTGATREDARRGMVLALRGISVRGEIRTSTAYVLELLERQEFRDCDVSTAWLDGLIAQRMKECTVSQSAIYPALLAASILRMRRFEDNNMDKYTSFLQAGHTPSIDYLSNQLTETFVLHSQKYVVDIGKLNANEYCVALNGSVITVPCRVLNTGGIQITVGSRGFVAYGEEEPTSLRVTIQGKSITFTGDVDPTKLRSSVPGRLVRYLIPDGGVVQENAAYAEVEVMKMILQLRSAVSGVMQIRATAGCTVTIGKLLAEVLPEDPSKVKRPVDNCDPWPESMVTACQSHERLDAVQRARSALDTLWSLTLGYHCPAIPLHDRIQKAMSMLPSVSLTSVTLASLNRPYLNAECLQAVTPIEKLKAVYACIVNEYMRVESQFDTRTRQEAVTALREKEESAESIFAMDFSHFHDDYRLEVLKALLGSLENNRQLMVSCQELLSTLATLQSSHYGSVLLKARYLVRQCSLPSFEDRKADLAKQLESGNLEGLMKGSYGFDLMCAVMYDNRAPHLAQLAVELFIRRAHFGVHTVCNIDIDHLDGASLLATYHFSPLGEDHDPIYRPTLSDDDTSDASSLKSHLLPSGLGYVAVFADAAECSRLMPKFLHSISQDSPKDVKSCANIFLSVRSDTTIQGMAATCSERMASLTSEAMNTTLELVTFLVHGVAGGPHIFTFRRSSGFTEDPLFRHLIPTSAWRLELGRLVNYTITKYPTPHRQVHVFFAQPIKKSAVLPIEHRLFVRMFVSPRDLHVEPWTRISEMDAGQAMSLCISAMEFARSDKKLANTSFNHLFIHLIELTVDVSTMVPFFRKLAEMYWKRLFSLGIREAEIKFKVSTEAGYVPFRIQILNHTGHAMLLRCYAETQRNGEIFLRRMESKDDAIQSTNLIRHGRSSSMSDGNSFAAGSGSDATTPLTRQASLHSPNRASKGQEKLDALRRLLPPRTVEPFAVTNDSFSRHTDPAGLKEEEFGEVRLDAYPILPQRQIKRLIANSIRTTYVQDWMVIFEVAIRQQWREFVTKRGLTKDAVPPHIVQPTLLYVDSKTHTLTPDCVRAMPCGVVVWVVEYYPSTYFDIASMTAFSRRIVVVANDITFQSGSFAVPEDVAFKLASDYARSERIPFVYLSANSGARLGLCTQVKEKFRVAIQGDSFEYLYLTEADYLALTEAKIVINTERLQIDGDIRYRIVDVVGAPHEYLGVENLQGSALIAGHMSLNYATIPTISVATGRTVGIGAYLVRLGRRVVQTQNAPIILTGAGALNRLLGKEVYSDNSQLGGNAIMVPNGVTHWEAKNDLAAIHVVLKWLDFVPEVSSFDACQPRVLSLPVLDPVDRDVTFVPGRDETYDPRFLVCGNPATKTTGMFDEGSWVESLSGWAKTVVVGRATLGGTPCGVILVETRITKKFDPADPADPTSTSSFISQAGQVWFPDSARKTADALDDFHKERLPCFILANWRGFSGGMRDMYDEVLKFGASIVDNLRVYNAPVFIYIPPFGELRGGAWVVVDPVINHHGVVEMYCDETARGGILEPAGVVEIKFREADVRELIRRNDAKVKELMQSDAAEAKKRETSLLPFYNDVAVHFADLHDTPGRMKARRCVVDVVPWKNARRQFHAKLQRKLAELELARKLVTSGAASTLEEATNRIVEQFAAQHEVQREQWFRDDAAATAFLSSPSAQKILQDSMDSVASEKLEVALKGVSTTLDAAAVAALAAKIAAVNPSLLAALKQLPS